MKKVNIGVWLGILRTLKYCWKEIDYKYEYLTVSEKEAISETEFNYLVQEIMALDEEEKNGVIYK